MTTDKIISQIIDILNVGGTILYPTDTIWGLGCDACNPQAVEKIYRIKQRNPEKSMLILCADLRQAANYIEDFPGRVRNILSEATRPTTIIYPKARNLPSNLTATDGSIGIRIPKSLFCNNLLKVFGRPIVSTSANFSGKPSPASFSDIDKKLFDNVDFVVPQNFDDSQDNTTSQILKITTDGEITVIRK